jgi:hypothetical protein
MTFLSALNVILNSLSNWLTIFAILKYVWTFEPSTAILLCSELTTVSLYLFRLKLVKKCKEDKFRSEDLVSQMLILDPHLTQHSFLSLTKGTTKIIDFTFYFQEHSSLFF